jgi:hypothetical protein
MEHIQCYHNLETIRQDSRLCFEEKKNGRLINYGIISYFGEKIFF